MNSDSIEQAFYSLLAEVDNAFAALQQALCRGSAVRSRLR